MPPSINRTLGRLAIVLCACLLAVTSGVRAASTGAGGEPDVHVAAAKASLERLPTADRAGQLVMTSIPGATLDARAVRALRSIRPGGVIVFGENYRSRTQLARLLRSTQVASLAGDASRPRVLVSIDQEGGLVKRIADAPPVRSHEQLGVTDRPALTMSQATGAASVLRTLGIRMDLAPVADLDHGPHHVMRGRSFGSNPARVSTHVAAFVDGLQAGRVAASVKHFPGFGGASVNSDYALARITRSRTQLDADLAPFRAAVDAGTESVMVSHGVYTALDRRRPASTSPATYRLLRGELAYDGVVITDSLHAAGFAAATRGRAVDGCVSTIVAGADVALLTGSLGEAAACRARIIVAVRAGTIPRARLDQAALRVLVLKSRLGLLPPLG